MPERLTDAEFGELLAERDAFKLAIRGQAALEAEMLAGITEAFPGRLPSALRRINFPARLALAEAVGVVPAGYTAGLKALAALRHDFAHGEITELSAERAARLRQLFLDQLSDEPRGAFGPRLERSDPVDSLTFCLGLARAVMQTTARFVREEREAARNALAIQRAIRERVAALQQQREQGGEGVSRLIRALAEQREEPTQE